MPGFSQFALALAALLPCGCIIGTAADVATAPVRVASKTVDLATTSQSEADEKRGRELRESEKRLARLERLYARQLRQCRDGDHRACGDSSQTYAEMQLLKRAPQAPQPDPEGQAPEG